MGKRDAGCSKTQIWADERRHWNAGHDRTTAGLAAVETGDGAVLLALTLTHMSMSVRPYPMSIVTL